MLEVDEMPDVDGLEIPGQLWWALSAPPLAGMAYPTDDACWTRLHAAGFRAVVGLTATHAPYDPQPLDHFGVNLQDLVSGGPPRDPTRELEAIRSAVQHILNRLAHGDGVVVHCAGGRGRTGTVVGATLVALGHGPNEVTDWLHRVHTARNRPGWPESPWQREQLHRFVSSR